MKIIMNLILLMLITPFTFGMERVEHNDQENQQEIISIKSVAIKSIVTGEFIRAVDGKGYYVYRTGTEIEPWHKFRLITLRNLDEFTSEVALKSEFSNKYVGIQSVEKPVLVAENTEIGENEKFLLYDMGAGRIALDSVPIRKFVRINEGNNRNLIADSSSTDERETFELVKESIAVADEPEPAGGSGIEGEEVEISAAEVSGEAELPDNGEADELEVYEDDESESEPENFPDPSSDEYGIDEGIEDRIDSSDDQEQEFPAEDINDAESVNSGDFIEADPRMESDNLPQVIALQSSLSDKYVRAGVGKGSFLAAVSDNVDGWQKFNIIQLGEGAVALQSSKSDKFVKPTAGSGSILAATGLGIDEAEKFTIVQLEDGKIAFQSLDGKYLRAGVGKYSYLAVVSDRIGVWETFKLIDLNSY